MANSSGKVRVVAKITINAAPHLVYEYLINLKYHFLWNPHLRTISPIIILKQGSSYKSSSVLLGVKVKGHNKATKLVENKELQIENQTGLIRYSVNYKLRLRQNQTSVVCTTSVNTDYKPLHFAESVMRVLAKRELQSDLQALKIAVEHGIR
jgi:hypothetical protein